MAALPTIKLNKETLGLVTACFTVAGSIFGVYNWLLSGRAENAPIVKEIVLQMRDQARADAVKDAEQDNRLDRTDEDRARFNQNVKELTDKTGELKEAVVKLTTVIEHSPTRKAEYFFENSPASPTLEVRR